MAPPGGRPERAEGTSDAVGPAVRRGREALRELLETQRFDLRELDVAAFRAWLERHLEHWRRDPAFVQRSRIRNLRRRDPELLALEAEARLARAADEASALHPRLSAAEHDLVGAEKAVAGLSYALGREDDATERDRLRLKRETFQARAAAARAEIEELTGASPERRALRGIEERLARRRAFLGLEREEERLRELQRKKGRSTSRSGTSFEERALEAVRTEVLPELDPGRGGEDLVVLRGVTLGAARMEIDQLVVRPSASRESDAEVLALVEAKRNVNDLAHGLWRRLENLAWLAGHPEGYEKDLYRTRAFPEGLFEGVAVHSRPGERHRFTADSFQRFLPDLAAGTLPERLYLVTRPGPLWGIDSAGLARIAHRISTDEAWEPEDLDYLARLLDWSRGHADEEEAPEVLRRYAADREASRRVLLLEG